MYKPNFKVTELKDFLETHLGFPVRELKRLEGGGAINYRAERASDGLLFVVKCFVPDRRANYEHLVANLKIMSGVKAPTRLFEKECPEYFHEYSLVCLEWKLGDVSDPSLLTDEQWQAFLRDYRLFADRIQQIVVGKEPDGTAKPGERAIIHGDFHPGNVLFKNGEVVCFMDLENFRPGMRTSDILLYCLYAARRYSPKSEDFALILKRFLQAVAFLPYSREEWLENLRNGVFRSIRKETKGFKHLGFFALRRVAKKLQVMGRFIKALEEKGDSCL